MQFIIVITSIIFFVSYVLLIIYYRQNWINIPDFIKNEKNSSQIKITVVIAARNEERNIKSCLDAVCHQSYPQHLYQVFVVDDFSTDKTADLVLAYASQNVKLISLKNFVDESSLNSYKKKAIEIAINQSTAELIVTTDADCIVKKDWLQTIASYYEENKPALIVMPVTYTEKNNFLETFQTLDFMALQGITGAAVHKKALSMCNGANLGYTKRAFNEVGGFKNIDTIASGDDMLLMYKIFKRYPNDVKFLKSKEVIVQTKPMQTLAGFLNQRIRWASKADKYDDKRIFAVLIGVYLFNVWIVVLAIAALFVNLLVYWFIGLLVSKTLIELFFLYSVAKFFDKKYVLWWFPIAQPFHILYTIVAGWLGKFGKYQWKGRSVR